MIVLTGVLSLGLWGGAAGRADRLGAGAFDRLRPGSWGASSWCFRRCSSLVTSLSVHNAVGFGPIRSGCKVYNVGRRAALGSGLTIDTAAELHADGSSAR